MYPHHTYVISSDVSLRFATYVFFFFYIFNKSTARKFIFASFADTNGNPLIFVNSDDDLRGVSSLSALASYNTERFFAIFGNKRSGSLPCPPLHRIRTASSVALRSTKHMYIAARKTCTTQIE
mmetsp:Transcript_9349/g.13003  ORF Transcript_9349/g.13003 Transcript_9349/m.13003 type:complete len:123 (+) Transcript_9349:181-549(+)